MPATKTLVKDLKAIKDFQRRAGFCLEELNEMASIARRLHKTGYRNPLIKYPDTWAEEASEAIAELVKS